MKRISKTEIKEMRSQSKKNRIMFAFTLPTVVGVRSIEHADENCKTFDWKLTEEEMKILDSKIEECAL